LGGCFGGFSGWGGFWQGGWNFDKLFNIHLDVDFNVFGELLIDCEWSIWEEELDGDVVIDAEQVAGG
jgi:hypothetical protein